MITNNNFLNDCKTSIIDGNIERAKDLAEEAIEKEIDILKVIDSLSDALKEVGNLWEEGEYFLPELMRSAEAMKAAMNSFLPVLSETNERQTLGKVVIGTIEGDIHDIGKTIVASMLDAEGFEVYDLGADVPINAFIDKALEVEAQIICVSALLTTTMTGQKKIIDELNRRGLRNKFKVLIGGAPVNKKWADEIGADGSADNAVAAVKLAKKVLS